MDVLQIRPCPKGLKKKVLDHMADMEGRYTSQTHFLIEAIHTQFEKDTQQLIHVNPPGNVPSVQ